MKIMLMYLLAAHIIGDYYLQDQYTADNKNSDKKIFQNHLIKYCIPFIVLIVFLRFNLSFIIASVLAVILHGVIDFGKREFSKKLLMNLGDKKVYLLDQVLHILSLVILSSILFNGGLHTYTFLENIFFDFRLNSENIVRWLLALLLIYKPSNITFSMLFSQYKPKDDELTDDKNLKAGGTIGVLEKFLCLILLSLGEFAAVGLVLTAKSIARYDKISKDPVFAEYYLIGTLTSITMVFLIFILCFQLLY